MTYRSAPGAQAGVTEDILEKVSSWREHDIFDDRERAALDYAERFALDHRSIDATYVESLRTLFDDGEIVDLTACIAKYLAVGRIVKVLELDHVCEL